MEVKHIKTDKGPIAHLSFETGAVLENYSDLFDAIFGVQDEIVALEQKHITHDFFDLRTGLAGEILQKISNYRRRLVILGDFDGVTSESLKAFIRESNRGGQVVFAPDLEAGVALLR